MPAWASNTLRTLSSLYLFTDRGVRWYDADRGAMGPVQPLRHATAVKERIAAVVAIPSPGMG